MAFLIDFTCLNIGMLIAVWPLLSFIICLDVNQVVALRVELLDLPHLLVLIFIPLACFGFTVLLQSFFFIALHFPLFREQTPHF